MSSADVCRTSSACWYNGSGDAREDKGFVMCSFVRLKLRTHWAQIKEQCENSRKKRTMHIPECDVCGCVQFVVCVSGRIPVSRTTICRVQQQRISSERSARAIQISYDQLHKAASLDMTNSYHIYYDRISRMRYYLLIAGVSILSPAARQNTI